MKENYTNTTMCKNGKNGEITQTTENSTERVVRMRFDKVAEFTDEMERLEKNENLTIYEIFVSFFVNYQETVTFRFTCVEQAICNVVLFAQFNKYKLLESVLIVSDGGCYV